MPFKILFWEKSSKKKLNSTSSQITDFVSTDPRYFRAEELKYLRGDCSKIKKVLGWKPEYTFEMMMDEMIEHWMEIYNEK